MSSIQNGVAPTTFGSFGNGIIGMDFVAEHTGEITGLRWFQAPTSGPATVQLRLWDAITQAMLATVNFNPSTPNAWNLANLAVPVAVTPGHVYTVTGHVFAGPGDNIAFTGNGLISNHLHLTADLTGLLRTGRANLGPGYPAVTLVNDLYGVDVEFAQTQTCPDCPPCPDVGAGPCVAPTGADPVFDLAQAILSCAYLAVDHTGDLEIARRCVVPGEIAWDDCQCGQLVVSETRRFGSRDFPLEEVSNEDACGEPYLVIDLRVSLTRCVPGPDSNGNPPTCDALSAAAAQLSKDKRDLRSAVMCCLSQIYDETGSVLVGFQLGPQETVGPEGMCAGSELQVLLGFANPCDC